MGITANISSSDIIKFLNRFEECDSIPDWVFIELAEWIATKAEIQKRFNDDGEQDLIRK